MDYGLCHPFNFLALYEAIGLEKDFDGILGLSPRKDTKHNSKHLLHSLKENGIIERSMVSFSLTQSGM
jgi:hypothetical protein